MLITTPGTKDAQPIALTKESNISEVELAARHAVRYELVDGEVVAVATGRCFPTEVQKMLAESMVKLLNAQIAHDGRWVCVWCHPAKQATYDTSTGLFRNRMPTLLQCLFLDQDGDTWTAVSIEEGVHEILEIGIHHYIEQCEEAYLFVRHLHKDVLDLREKDTFSPAKGEKATPDKDGYVPPPTAL